MSFTSKKSSSWRTGAILAGVVLLAMSSTSLAVIVGDDFNRADTTPLGNTPIGGYPWDEWSTGGVAGNYATIVSNQLRMAAGSGLAIAGVNEADLALSVDLRFENPTPPSPGGLATKGAGINLRMSQMSAGVPFYRPINEGLVNVQMLPNGMFYVAEQRGLSAYTQLFWDNPFAPGTQWQTFQPAGTLPTTINGAPFDANGNGALDTNETFRLGAIASGDFCQVQINGKTILAFPLANTSGISANKVSVMRNNWGGSGVDSIPNYDNLIGDTPPELPVAMDTFTRADSTTLGTSELGGYNWYERTYQGGTTPYPAISGYKLFLGDGNGKNVQAILDVNLPNIDVTTDLYFELSGSGDVANSSAGMMLRKPSPDVYYNGSAADGQIIIQVMPTGGFQINEQQGTTYAELYNDNPWSPGLGTIAFANPGDLPQFINGLPFDLNQDGRLDGTEETFELGAFLMDHNLDVLINGAAVLSFDNLAGTGNSGASGNYFSLVKNSISYSGMVTNPYYDNLSVGIAVPEPATVMLLGIALLGFVACGLKRRRQA